MIERCRRWSSHRLLVLALAAVAAACLAAAAWAYFTASASSGSAGEAVATTVNAGATPTASVSATTGREVDLTWGASTLANGQPVSGYVVTRYPSGGGAGTINPFSNCAGTVTGTSCQETAVPPGTWKYTITPVAGTNWTGPTSAYSGVVTVGAESLSVNGSPFNLAAFTGSPATAHATGSIGSFAGNEGVSYKLDSTGGTSLTGSPTSVAQNGNASITDLQLPQSSVSDGAHTVYAVGNASYYPSQASAGIVVDTVAPTVSAQLTPAPNGAGWNGTSPVQVTLTESDPSPSAGSGTIKYTTDGSDPTTSGTAQAYSGPFNVSTQGTTTVKYYGTDAAGNASLVATQLVKIDTLAPANSFSLTSQSGGGAFLVGSTLYYQGSNAGSFALSDNVTDSGSGPASAGYAALTGSAGGWSFSSSSVTSGPPYVSNAFSWSGGTTSNPSETATGFDVAGNSTPATFGLVNDSTAPTGGALTVNGTVASSGGSTSTSSSTTFTIGSRTDYTETQSSTQSGLASSVLTVQSFTYANGSCGSAAGPFSSKTTISGTTQPGGIVTGYCYTYTLTGTDNVGNAASVSTTVDVDTTPPSFGSPALTISGSFGPSYEQYASGTTLYYNAQGGYSGSFTVAAANVADAESGIQMVSFPTITGGPSGGGTDTVSPYQASYSWTSSTTGSGSQTVTATNGVGLTSSTTFTVTKDTTAPSGGAFTANGTVATAGGSSSYLTSGTTLTINSRTNYADAGSGLSSSTLTIQSATLSNNSCGSYGSATTISGTTSQTVSSGHCYLLILTGTDNVGNTASIRTTVMVDTTAPSTPTPTLSAASGNTYISGTTAYINAQSGDSGGFTVASSPTDSDTGIKNVIFPSLTGFTSGGGTDTSSPYQTSYSWSGAVGASGSQTVTATNNAGLTSASSFTVTPDTAAPGSGAFSANGTAATTGGSSSYLTSGTTLTINSRTNYSDAGSGLASSTLTIQSATLTNNACGSYGSATTISGTTSQTVASGNCYLLVLTGTDNVGNTASISTTVKVDTAKPSTTIALNPTSANGSNGWYKTTAPTFTLSASDSGGSGVASTFYKIGSGSTQTYSGSAVTIPDGQNTISYWSADNAGNTETTNTTATIKVDTAAPTDALTLAPSPTGAYLSGTTLYYKGNTAGSFKFVDTVSDATSGPSSATFPAIGTTGWTHSAETVSTPSGGPYTSSTYSWTSSPSIPSSQTITSTDNAGNAGAGSTITFTSDTTGPTGGAVTVDGTAATSGGSSSTAGNLGFTIGSRADYGDGGSGIASSVLTVQSETLSGGTCGSPGSGGPFTTPTTINGTNQPGGITTGYCYLYTLTGTDNVGNTSSIRTTVTVPPIVHVQDASFTGSGASLSKVTPTLAAPPTNGDTLILFVGDDSSTVSSVSGGGVPTWTKATSASGSGGSGNHPGDLEVWYGAVNCSGSCSASDEKVTVTLSSSNNVQLATISEWAGIRASGALDSAASQAVTSPSGTSFTTSSVTPTEAGELIVSAAWIDNKSTGTTTAQNATTGYTQLAETNAGGSYYRGYDAYLLDGDTNPITATWPNPGTNTYAWAIAAFEW